MKNITFPKRVITKKDDKNYFDNTPHVVELTPNNFDNIATWRLKTLSSSAKAEWRLKIPSSNAKCTAVLFYAPWCPHCSKMKDEWISFGKKAGFVTVAALNCEKYKEQLLKIREDMPELIKTFPTIIFYKGVEPIESFFGERLWQNFLKTSMRICQDGHR